jgi:ribosomal protein L11 methyltransferase
MPWTEITLTVPDDLKDCVTGELSDLGSSGIWESGEPSPGYTQLTAYFQNPPALDEIRSVLSPLFENADLIPPALKTGTIDDQDWGEKWKKSWKSFPMGRRFFIIPSWSDAVCPDDRFPLIIDPGQAFGTGTHETTQLTLEAMEIWMEPRRAVLDLGTGSGILAIAASFLEAKSIVACDNDPVAIEVARENLERNGVRGLGLMCGSIDAVAGQAVGFLLCNLTADAILEILPEIHRVMRPLGIAVFSGILNSQSAEIRKPAQALGLTMLQEKTRGEWCALVMRRNGP